MDFRSYLPGEDILTFLFFPLSKYKFFRFLLSSYREQSRQRHTIYALNSDSALHWILFHIFVPNDHTAYTLTKNARAVTFNLSNIFRTRAEYTDDNENRLLLFTSAFDSCGHSRRVLRFVVGKQPIGFARERGWIPISNCQKYRF